MAFEKTQRNLWCNGIETLQTEGRAAVKILRKRQALWGRLRAAVELKWGGGGWEWRHAQGSGQRPHSHRRECGPCAVLSAGTGIAWVTDAERYLRVSSLEEKVWKQRQEMRDDCIVLMSDASDLGPGGTKGATERKTSQLHTQNHSLGPVLSSEIQKHPTFKWAIERDKLRASPMPCEAMFDFSNLPLISPSRWTDPITLVILTVLRRVCPSRHLAEDPGFLPCSLCDHTFCKLAHSTCYEDPVSKDGELELIRGKTPESPEDEAK